METENTIINQLRSKERKETRKKNIEHFLRTVIAYHIFGNTEKYHIEHIRPRTYKVNDRILLVVQRIGGERTIGIYTDNCSAHGPNFKLREWVEKRANKWRKKSCSFPGKWWTSSFYFSKSNVSLRVFIHFETHLYCTMVSKLWPIRNGENALTSFAFEFIDYSEVREKKWKSLYEE